MPAYLLYNWTSNIALCPEVTALVKALNGAGKTTFANSFLPTFANCREFLNADLIAAGLAPIAPETQAVRASELLLRRIDALVAGRSTFLFETTLAARSYQASIKEWRRWDIA